MKKILLSFFCFVITCNLTAQADTILSRYKQYLFQTIDLRSDVNAIIDSLQQDGSWADIDYTDPQRGTWKPMLHLERVFKISYAYTNPNHRLYKTPTTLAAIKLALSYWVSHRFQSKNWWHNEIGVPRMIRDIIILIKNDVEVDLLKSTLQVMAQYKIDPAATGANLVWSADLGIHYGLLTGDTMLVKTCLDRILKEIKISAGEGLQPDYSFQQHGNRLQMYHYGGAFLWENLRLAWQLRNTKAAFPPDKILILKNFVLQGWQWMTRGINTVPGTIDRAVSRMGALHSSDIRKLLPFLFELWPTEKFAFERIMQHQNGNGALNGFRFYPYSDFTAFHQKNVSFFLKTISSRTLPTESINNENLKGKLLNSGDLYIVRDGREYYDLMPFWNWELLPGITSFNGAQKVNRKAYVGGLGDGQSGFASMDYCMEGSDTAVKITAKKSWFFKDGKVICLIAGLQGSMVDPVYTALDQCRWRDEVRLDNQRKPLQEGTHSEMNVTWVYHNKIMYMPISIDKLTVSVQKVSGNWKSINTSEIDKVEADKIFMPIIAHKDLHGKNSFGYLIAYSKTYREAKKIAKHHGYFSIIRNDGNCQAVSFFDGSFMAAFYDPGSIVYNDNIVEVDKPCLLMYSPSLKRFFISDPQQKNNTVTVRYNHKDYITDVPKTGMSGEIKL